MIGGLVRLIFEAAVFYAVIVALIYLFQRRLMYVPGHDRLRRPRDSGLPDMREVAVPTADGLLLRAWFQPPRRPGGAVVVYFHGNAGHIGHRAGKAAYYLDAGYGVFLCEYRGYGGNAGTPTEAGLYRDGRAAIAWLQDNGFALPQMIFYGESIGAGVAVQLAREFSPPVLILEAPFTSAVEMGLRRYPWLPVERLIKDRFDNLAKIGGLKNCDLLIVHGDEDANTPIAFAKRLFDAAPHPKEFIAINQGGHNDLYEHHAGHVITDWLKKRPALRSEAA